MYAGTLLGEVQDGRCGETGDRETGDDDEIHDDRYLMQVRALAAG